MKKKLFALMFLILSSCPSNDDLDCYYNARIDWRICNNKDSYLVTEKCLNFYKWTINRCDEQQFLLNQEKKETCNVKTKTSTLSIAH